VLRTHVYLKFRQPKAILDDGFGSDGAGWGTALIFPNLQLAFYTPSGV